MRTIETIESKLMEFGGVASGKNNWCAQEIYSAIQPAYKPLSELHKDEESCHKLFAFVFPKQEFIPNLKIKKKDSRLVISGWVKDVGVPFQIAIEDTGQIYPKMVETNVYLSVFALADFVRSLGYSA